MFSMPTARQLRMTKAAPAAASTVAGPCPRMRTERTPLSCTGCVQRVLSRAQADRAAGLLHLVHGVLDGELAAGVRLWAVTQAVQLQSWPSAVGGQGWRQSVTVPAPTSQMPSRA